MHPDGVLIVGASQAGAQVAISLREIGATCPITLVGAEHHLPYQRPPLSKAFLAGRADHDALLLRPAAFYAEHGIEVVTGERIVSIEMDDDPECLTPTGGSAVGASGRTFDFGRLALAVGGTPRRLDVPGAGLADVCYLRDLADASSLRSRLAQARRVVVVGGGFVGLEVAAAANAMGKSVVVVEALDRLMARAVAPVVSAFYADAHRRRGIDVRLGAGVVGFAGRDRVTAVELSDGSSLPADLVLVGIGLVPHTGLAEQLGLEVAAGGIVVDERACTSRVGTVAAGDCTSVRWGEGVVRIESVAHAIAQGRAAAATLAGVDAPGAAVPWFWSDQSDLKLQIAGLSAGYDDVVVRGEPGRETFSALYFRDDDLIAIDAINAPRDYMAVRRILELGGTVPREAAGDVRVELKSFIAR